jgi:D-alanyl-D-alanine carboxypeptidase (penicillin-binding protein 5/6)
MRLRQHLVGVLAALFVASPGAALAAPSPWEPLPPLGGWVAPGAPAVSAPSWILYDETSNWVIAASDPDARRSLASTTKMMTALVAVDHAGFDDLVTVSTAAAEAGEAEIGLVAGEKLGMDQLLTAMLVRSANDAAEAIAEYVAGSAEGFAKLMNEKAVELGLTNSHFTNPHGLDDPDHYSSAADLLLISRAVLANPQLAAMVRSVRVDFPSAPDGAPRGGPATNELLRSYEGAMGVKTGYTFQASLVLAAAAERDGRRLYAVVMGSEGTSGHFLDATQLLDYGFERARIPPLAAATAAAARLQAEARIETLAWLGASGLLAGQDLPTRVIPNVYERKTATVPGWRDAFSWVPRYWAWLAGER